MVNDWMQLKIVKNLFITLSLQPKTGRIDSMEYCPNTWRENTMYARMWYLLFLHAHRRSQSENENTQFSEAAAQYTRFVHK